MTDPYAPATRHLVFVYGTLKRGFSNAHYLNGQSLVGPAHTSPGFRLYRITDYPGMVADTTDTEGITGEVWEVDGPCLRRLDTLEGLKEGLYTREPITLQPPFDDRIVHTYLYARDISDRTPIPGDWQEFKRRR